ncbi:hypothetical protein [Fusibacter bizertensis]
MSYRDELIEILKQIELTYYSNNEKNEMCKYVMTYNHNRDFCRIQVLNNEAIDSAANTENEIFRTKLGVFLSLNNELDYDPVILNDLIESIGDYSKVTIGAPEHLGLISEILLKKSKGKYLNTFGRTLLCSMDTYGSCIYMDLSTLNVGDLIKSLGDFETCDEDNDNLIAFLENIM